MIGLGTMINVVAILLGGLIGLTAGKQMSNNLQITIRNLLGLVTFLVAISMIWSGIKKSENDLALVGISMLSLVLGNAIGKLLKIQKRLNKAGQSATERFSKAATSGGKNFNEGFITATLIFCVGPMSILGAIEDGLGSNFSILAVKSAMDGLASVAFASTFGAGVLLAALPVGVYQGTITLLAAALSENLSDPMIASIGITGGMIVMILPMIIMNLYKAPISDYLPALVVAPLLTLWWVG